MSNSKRVSIDVAGAGHASPIPAASRIGNVMITGHVYGRDPATNDIAPGIAAQVPLLFQNLRAILEAAGATPENVLKLSFKVKTLETRPLINKEWSAMFPDPHSRPARQVDRTDELLDPAEISCEAFVVFS